MTQLPATLSRLVSNNSCGRDIENRSEMNLPHASVGFVDRGKIIDYLLNTNHPDNGGKARFFIALGFRADDWAKLATACCMLAMDSPVCLRMDSEHGTKYVVDGTIETRTGRSPAVRTIWVIDLGETVPRLATAFSYEECLDD